MQRLWLTGAAIVLAAMIWTAAATAGVTRYYGPGVLGPGAGAGSSYDSACERWIANDMIRNVSSFGTVTFIDLWGGWHDTLRSWGTETLQIVSRAIWTKKAHCYNSWNAAYWANCSRSSALIDSCIPG
jgi:hypothetical protein